MPAPTLHPDFLPTECQRAECAVLTGRMTTAMQGLPDWRAGRLKMLRRNLRHHVRHASRTLLARWLNDYRDAIESELTSAAYWQRSSVMAPMMEAAE